MRTFLVYPAIASVCRGKCRIVRREQINCLHRVVIKVERESAASHLTERAYAELGGEGAQGEFLDMIVPGRSELRLVKELDLG